MCGDVLFMPVSIFNNFIGEKRDRKGKEAKGTRGPMRGSQKFIRSFPRETNSLILAA